MEEHYTGEIKPCPFCGHEPARYNLLDSLHPTHISWFKSPALDILYYGENIESTHYTTERTPLTLVLESDLTESGKCWVFTCLQTEGGCDAQVHGDSVEEVMQKWNKRA